MIWQKINYIHANPVKANLVKSAKDYRWSSFRVFYNGASDPLPVDKDWWWPDDAEKLSKSMKNLVGGRITTGTQINSKAYSCNTLQMNA